TAEKFDLSSFGFAATPRPDKTTDDVAAAVDDVLAKLLKDGVTADEVAGAEKRLGTTEAYAQDGIDFPIEIIGRALCTGGTLADVDAWPQRIQAVTAEQVMAAAHDVLDGKPAVTRLLLPADAATAARAQAEPDMPSSLGEIR